MRGKRMFLLVSVLSLCFLVSLTVEVFAQGEHSPQVNAAQGQRAGIKEGPVSDRQQIKEQRRGDNPQGVGPGNPAGVEHPSRYLDRKEDFRDRREDSKDRREDFRDRREDVKDRREDFRERREEYRDKPYHPGIPGDRFKNKPQHKPDLPGRAEFKGHPQHDRGVRDHGAGVGAGRGQGGAHRAGGPGPRGGGRRK